MAARIIIKPYRIQPNPLHDYEDKRGDLSFIATPEFLYPGMPAIDKPHSGSGLDAWSAIISLAKQVPQDLQDKILERSEEEIYCRPDCPDFDELVLDMDGYVPDKKEWLRQRQWYNRYGSLKTYFKEKEDEEFEREWEESHKSQTIKTQSNMEIKGTIIKVLEPQSGVSKTGNPWKIQGYVMEIPGNYPKNVAFEVFGEERIEQNKAEVGENVTIQCEPESREFGGRWYTTLRAWKVEKTQAAAQPVKAEAPKVAGAEEASSQLPFD